MALLAQTPSLRARQASLRTCARRAERAIKMQVSDCVATALTRARQARAGEGSSHNPGALKMCCVVATRSKGARDHEKMAFVDAPSPTIAGHGSCHLLCEMR